MNQTNNTPKALQTFYETSGLSEKGGTLKGEALEKLIASGYFQYAAKDEYKIGGVSYQIWNLYTKRPDQNEWQNSIHNSSPVTIGLRTRNDEVYSVTIFLEFEKQSCHIGDVVSGARSWPCNQEKHTIDAIKNIAAKIKECFLHGSNIQSTRCSHKHTLFRFAPQEQEEKSLTTMQQIELKDKLLSIETIWGRLKSNSYPYILLTEWTCNNEDFWVLHFLVEKPSNDLRKKVGSVRVGIALPHTKGAEGAANMGFVSLSTKVVQDTNYPWDANMPQGLFDQLCALVKGAILRYHIDEDEAKLNTWKFGNRSITLYEDHAANVSSEEEPKTTKKSESQNLNTFYEVDSWRLKHVVPNVTFVHDYANRINTYSQKVNDFDVKLRQGTNTMTREDLTKEFTAFNSMVQDFERQQQNNLKLLSQISDPDKSDTDTTAALNRMISQLHAENQLLRAELQRLKPKAKRKRKVA